MNQRLCKTRLPNGLDVYCLKRSEAATVHDQVQHYFRHCITIGRGDTVFDVVANIGMFSLEVDKRSGGTATVFAFEPIPATFAALEANVRQHCQGEVRTFCCALSAKAGEIEFGFYPHFTMLSSAYHTPAEEEEIREQLKASILRNIADAPPSIAWIRWLPRPLQVRVLDLATRHSFRQMQKIRCPLRTVSEVIREHGLTKIDLLKVDAEKSEWDVLLGVHDEDWPKIRQVAMEVHDVDGRLELIRSLLTQHQFQQMVVEQETMLRGSNVFSLFARRDHA